MNEIVKYDNYMNSLRFTGFTVTDFNFLMALCSRMRDKDITEITIPFEELRLKTAYTRTSIQKFRADLERMNEKLMRVTCKLRTETKTIMFVLFPTFEIDMEKQELTVVVNEKFKFILNELVKNFTRFDLKEFIKLDSKYSKSLYRLLKQFKSTGILEISLNEFRGKMDIPSTYTNRDVMSKVINPTLEELQNYFQNLQCTVKYEHKRGKPVSGYIFTFTPEQLPKTASKELPADEPSEPQKELTQEEKNKLIDEYGADVTEDYIKRTTQYHCCDYDTIKKWIAEDKEKERSRKPKKNTFTDIPQRDYDFDELEKALLRRN